MAKITELPIVVGDDITNYNYSFVVASAGRTEQLSWEEIQKSFTGFTAQGTDGFNIIGKSSLDGIYISDDGFLGVNNASPSCVLDIGDNGGATYPELRLISNHTRPAYYTIGGDGIYWRMTKKGGDQDLYIQVSDNDTNYTGVININRSGCVGIFDGASDMNVNEKFYVKSSGVRFDYGDSAIVFDLYQQEIKTVAGDSLYINYTNNNNTIIGSNTLFVNNDSVDPRVGINTSSPSTALDIYGSGNLLSIGTNDNTTDLVSLALSKNNYTGYIVVDNDSIFIGPNNSVSSTNICYRLGYLGLGTAYPNYKLHVDGSTSRTISKFETSNDTSEVFQVNNGSGPTTWNTIYTFGRAYYSGPTLYQNRKKWGIGLYENGSDYNDAFVFRVGADTSSVSSIKASLNTDGDFDVKGGYTSNTGNYCKGKFVQIYQTRLTGDCIYFNPFYGDSNTNPSGSNDFHAPFGVSTYSGTIENIKIFSSDQGVTSLAGEPRFQISIISPDNDTNADGYVSGFYVAPSESPTSLPTSGIVAQFSLSNVDTANTVYSYDKVNFSGDASFDPNQLIQYRICENAGSLNVDFTVVSTISYTVT